MENATIKETHDVTPARLDLLVFEKLALAFEAPSPSQFQAMSKEAMDELAGAQEAVARLGPAALFAAGGALAQAGRWREGIEFRRRAVGQAATPGRCYGLIQLMQLAGWWESAGEALDTAPRNSPAVACLRLQQVQHDFGQVTSQDLPRLDPESLIRARFSLLAGEPCEYVNAPAGSPREEVEETLRVNLALAVRAKDLARLSQWMDEAMFHLLPVPETEFYRGVRAWLEGDGDSARRKLERAIEMAPDFLPAIRCLAAVRADQGDHQAAGALWDKATKLAPADGRAVVHRALQFAAAGRTAEGIASLRGYCARAPQDELARYCLARLELSAAFRRAVGAGNHEWETVEKPASRAATILERLVGMPEAAWHAWVCRVLQTPPQLWSERANALLAAEPAQASAAPPMEAQWLRGQLRTLARNFETALEGMSLLAGFAGRNLNPASARQLSAAWWRVALQATTAEQASHFAACAEPMARDASESLDFIAARFGVRPPMAGGEGRPPVTAGNIQALLAAGDTAALGSLLDKLRRDADRDEKRRLLAGILALELRAFEAFEQVAAGASADRRWEILKAVALAKQGHKDAAGAFCTLLARNPVWPATPRLAGVFAFLGAKSRKHAHKQLAETLAAFPAEAAAGDHEIALNFLRASALVGEPQRATRLLENHAHLMSAEVHQELRRVRCHEAARAIHAGDYARAATVMREVEPGSGGDLREMRARADRLAAVAALLGALSPHQTLRADAARFHGLADLLEGMNEPISQISNAASRDRLRNRLADCRRNQPATQWQAHFRSLTILHWEWGLTAMKQDPTLADEALECFRFANFLWRHLLTDGAFWTNFAAAGAISPAEAAAVRDRIEAEIFDCHREQAHLYLAASDAEGCRVHLSCLQGWDQPPKMQFLIPDSVSPPRPEPSFSLDRAGALNTRATAAFDAWVDQVSWRARKLRDDPAARDRLPPGMKCDYDAAIKMVGQALEAVPEHHRLCMFLAEQHADCAFALVGAERREDARDKLRSAIPIVRRIANEKFRGKRLTGPDGDLIRRVFDYAWKLETDDRSLIPLLREYLHWNGPDADAERQLHMAEAAAAYAKQDYDTVIEHLRMVKGDQQAEEMLVQSLHDRALEQIKSADEIAGYWSDEPVSSTDRKRLLAEAGEKYKRAEADFAAAAALRPQRTDLHDFLKITRGRLEWLKEQLNLTE